MKRLLGICVCLHLGLNIMTAQNADYAGPDQTACQGSGALIGNTNPGNVCYTWDAADGLDPNDLHSIYPTVHPQYTTTYTVHVVGNNFNFSTTDQVKVVVDFGGIVINPAYIKLGGPLTNQATAVLNVNDLPGGSGPITWSIENGGSTGCTVDQNGVVSNCAQDGQVTVRATSQNYPDCYAEKVLRINGGIKEVVASDNANDGRTAKNGATLYLVGPTSGDPTGTVNFKAVPNDNSSFPEGQPSWTGSFTAPGNIPTWDSPPLGTGTYSETAGTNDPKSVNVQVVNPGETSVTINVNTGLVQAFIDKIKGNTKVKEQDAFCSSPLSFSLPGALSASFKGVNVPKYKDPNYGTKKEVAVDIPGISVTGCVYFPCCTGAARFGPAYIYYFTYLGSSIGLNLNVAANKDPSQSANPMWNLSNLAVSVSGKVEAGLRVESEFSGNAGFIGGANLSTEGKLECRYVQSPDRLEWNLSYGGLVGKVSAALWYGTMDNTIEVAYQKSLVPGSETGFQLLYDMSGL